MADCLPVLDEMDHTGIQIYHSIDARTVSYIQALVLLCVCTHCTAGLGRSVHVPSKMLLINCTRIRQRLSMSNTSRLLKSCWPTTTPPSEFPLQTRPWPWEPCILLQSLQSLRQHPSKGQLHLLRMLAKPKF